MNAKPEGFYAPDPRPRWKQWLQHTFFPQHRLESDDEPLAGFTPGEVLTVHEVYVDWKDRIRLLVSGRFGMETRHRVDVPIARVRSRSQFNVSPPAILDRRSS